MNYYSWYFWKWATLLRLTKQGQATKLNNRGSIIEYKGIIYKNALETKR